MLYQIFHSPQAKQSVVNGHKNDMYALAKELLIDLSLGILGN